MTLVKKFQVRKDFLFSPVFALRAIFQTFKDFTHGFLQPFQKKKGNNFNVTHENSATVALILR